MKFQAGLLALLVGSTAAFAPQPVAPKTTARFSYLGSLDGDGRAKGTSAPTYGTSAPSTTRPVNGASSQTSRVTPASKSSKSSDKILTKNVWDMENEITVQGGSLRTWTFTSPKVEGVQVVLKTEGRPLTSDVELWQGPDNTPQKMAVYVEDGSLRPFNAVIATPRGYNAIAIRNTGHLEFPLQAGVAADVENEVTSGSGLIEATKELGQLGERRTIQGGALHTYPFEPSVGSVQVLLETDGRPLNARIELLQGPNNIKQVIELYTEDGRARPFFAVIETPGSGNVVRIVNTGTVEFPLTACVEQYDVDSAMGNSGGDTDSYFVLDRQW